MSGVYQDTGGRSDTTNQSAAHDSGFYDPSRYDNQIVAVFENREAAHAAMKSLVDQGIPGSAVSVIDHVAGDAAPERSQAEDRADGVLQSLMRLFTPSEDRSDYHHAVGRGHALLVLTPTPEMDRHRAIKLVEQAGPIDFDARLAEWRQAGYDRSGAARSPEHRGAGERDSVYSGLTRSYRAERATGHTVASRSAGMDEPVATPDVESSGMNSPRR